MYISDRATNIVKLVYTVEQKIAKNKKIINRSTRSFFERLVDIFAMGIWH